MPMSDEQNAHKLQAILDFAENLFVLCNIKEDFPLRNSGSNIGLIYRIDTIRQNLAELGLRDADLQSQYLLSGLREQLYRSDLEIVNGFFNDLQDILQKLRQTIEQEAERRSLYFVIPGYRFMRFESPEFMHPQIPPQIERFLDEAERCWNVGFELAAVMLTLVATEVLNRHHYNVVIVQNPENESRQTWGDFVKHYPDLKLEPVLDELVQQRNKVMHGKLEVDERSAISIIEKCAQISNQLVERLRRSDQVSCQPTPEEIDSILMAASCVVKKSTLDTLVCILKGEATDEILEKGWNKLKDFGVFADYGFPWIDDKVGWLFDKNYLRKYHKYACFDYENEEIRNLTQSLWVKRLFPEITRCLDRNDFETAWTWLATLSVNIKKALLAAIRDEEREDFAPVLRFWFEKEEVRSVRSAINCTLQQMNLSPLRHPRRRKESH